LPIFWESPLEYHSRQLVVPASFRIGGNLQLIKQLLIDLKADLLRLFLP